MKKNLPILLLASLLTFGVVACGETGTPSSTPSGTGGSEQTSEVSGVTVEKVEIEYDGETTLLGGSRASLKASVTGSETGLKVTWSSSDESVAKVTNGTVVFQNPAVDTEVTITATSRNDATKKAEVKFTVLHSPFNLGLSRGDIDSSMYTEDGTFIAATGDNALVFDGVHGTKWYVEAEVMITDQDPADLYPKIGIMAGTDAGFWNADGCKNIFWYVDEQLAGAGTGWVNFNTVGQNDTHSDWNWASQFGGVSVEAASTVKKNEYFKIGLLRDGVNYVTYAGVGEHYQPRSRFTYTDTAADEDSYAWIGGWKTGITVKNPKAFVGDAVNDVYGVPEDVKLSAADQTLFAGDTYQIVADLGIKDYNPNLLTFTSRDPNVATVDANGLVTAGNADGETVIDVKYGEIAKEIKITVTTDVAFKVVLDGKKDDVIWSESVKNSVVTISREDFHAKVDVIASRNSRGVYFFADYEAANEYGSATNWWEGDNLEMRMVGNKGILPNKAGGDQYFISTSNGGVHTFSDAYISRPTLNEETGYYEVKFEFFVSYDDLGLTRDSNVAFHMGANPGGNNVGKWFCENDKWLNGNIAVNNKITKNGIVTGAYTEETCTEHKHENWVTEVQVTCTQDGIEKCACSLCGNEITREVKSTGEHVWNESEQTVSKVPTCTEEGLAGAPCYGTCGVVNESITLPKDQNNHSAWDAEAGKCTDCGSTIEHFITNDRSNAGGWGGVDTWTYVARNLSGDFVVTANIHLQTTNIVGNWWHGILPVIQEALPEGSVGQGSPWVTRLDWYGWCDQWESTEKLTQEWNGLSDGDGKRDEWWSDADGNNVTAGVFENAMSDSQVVWTITRTGTTVRNDFTFTAVDGTVSTYWSVANDIATTKNLNIAIASEFAKYTVTKVTIA